MPGGPNSRKGWAPAAPFSMFSTARLCSGFRSLFTQRDTCAQHQDQCRFRFEGVKGSNSGGGNRGWGGDHKLTKVKEEGRKEDVDNTKRGGRGIAWAGMDRWVGEGWGGGGLGGGGGGRGAWDRRLSGDVRKLLSLGMQRP